MKMSHLTKRDRKKFERMWRAWHWGWPPFTSAEVARCYRALLRDLRMEAADA